MSVFRLTPLAKKDLAKIYRYTDKQWGRKQAKDYVAVLKADCAKLACGEKIGKSLPEYDLQLETYHSQHHYLFFLRQPDHIGVISILHETMDMPTHIRERLEDDNTHN